MVSTYYQYAAPQLTLSKCGVFNVQVSGDARHTSGFISFLKTNCSSQDYLFITECFDEFVDQIKSQELINAFRETMEARFPEETQKYHIDEDLEEALQYYGDGSLH